MERIAVSKPLTVFQAEGLEHDARTLDQIRACLEDERAVAGALCADGHLGYAMPIGGVIAYDGAISPTGVGFDIACGNMCVRTDVRLRDFVNAPSDCPDNMIPLWDSHMFNEIVKPTMREIQKRVEFGVGRSNPTPIDHELFEDDAWHEIDRQFGIGLKDKARAQLGTVGSGNHYVDLLVDAEGWVWVANHFGSRGLGHTIASGFMAAAAGKKFTERVSEGDAPVVFPTDTEIGTFYVAAMQLAGMYAYAGREYVIGQVLEILGAKAEFTVHNHHNYAWFENGLWVVRKGATPLTRKPAFIGGSMGDVSVIVRGYPYADPEKHEAVDDIGALGSAPHGAGRVMSRTAAAGKLRKMISCSNRDCDWLMAAQPDDVPEACPQCGSQKFRKIRTRDPLTAAIDWQATRAHLTARGITVLGAGADEAPGVYKPLADVLAAHSNIEVLYTLRPIGVVMAGPDMADPYQD